MIWKTAGMAVACVVLAACAGKAVRTGVAHEMILPEGAERTEVQDRQQFVMALPYQQPLPAYPAGVTAVAAQLPVCVEFVVGEDGAVRSQRLLEGVPDCVAAGQPGAAPFVQAALAAVSQWQFFGAGLCSWQQEEAECDDGRAEVTPVAIRLSYRFVFSSEGTVATARLTPRPARRDVQDTPVIGAE